jgi:uncharacterized DUF497 family protein
VRWTHALAPYPAYISGMSPRFTWDSKKAASNYRKHGVSFPEVATAFGDPDSITIPDPDHSLEEERFIPVGQSLLSRLLVVVHVERADELIRLTSARPANRHERSMYEEEA